MAKDKQGVEIKVGDTITIKAQGTKVKGKVTSASWFENYQVGKKTESSYTPNGLPGDSMDGWWYIELTEANVPGGYSYWKQGEDGGKVIEVNEVAI